MLSRIVHLLMNKPTGKVADPDDISQVPRVPAVAGASRK
jgi:hypothetical protein